jgi:hypothetical protein
MTTRTILFDNGDFSLHATLSPTPSPHNSLALTITSQRQGSRNPHEEHVRFFACLDREGLRALARLIQSELHVTAEGAQS